MAVDPLRAAFVKNEFRYSEQSDATVKANYTNSNLVIHDTQLSATDAATVATAYLNATKGFAQAYQVDVVGTLTLENLVPAPPQYTVSFPQFATDGRTFRLVSATVDLFNNRTTLVIRG